MEERIEFTPRAFCRFVYYHIGKGKPRWMSIVIYGIFALFIPAIFMDRAGMIGVRNIFLSIPFIFLALIHLLGWIARWLNNRDLRRLALEHGLTIKELERVIYVKGSELEI